jgi:hypothetical protein
MIMTREKALDLKIGFNDYCMRELGLDIDENDHIYDIESEAILQIKEKFIKYSEDLVPYLNFNEIDLNLIENFRLMETLAQVYLRRYADNNGMNIVGFSQSKIRGSRKGLFVVSHSVDGEIKEITSDAYENESVRVFNLICKLNHRSHLYDFDKFDIIIEKDKKRG